MASEEPLISGLAGRYATALFELAQEERAVETVERDFASLKALLASSADLARLVRAPVFSPRRTEEGHGRHSAPHGGRAADGALRAARWPSKGRLFVLLDVIRAFEAAGCQSSAAKSTREVTSARPLSDAEVSELKAMLKSKLGRDARLDAKVDPSLLGGLVVKVGSRMIDSSLRTKLEGLRAAMRGQ